MINRLSLAGYAAAGLLALAPALGQAQVLSTYILPTCPVTHVPESEGGQKAAAIVGLIVQQIISRGVDMAGAALNEAAKDKVLTPRQSPGRTTPWTPPPA
jgi:hypothetical protein